LTDVNSVIARPKFLPSHLGLPSQRQSGLTKRELSLFMKSADPRKDIVSKPLAELSDVTGQCKAEAVAFLQRHGLYQ